MIMRISSKIVPTCILAIFKSEARLADRVYLYPTKVNIWFELVYSARFKPMLQPNSLTDWMELIRFNI